MYVCLLLFSAKDEKAEELMRVRSKMNLECIKRVYTQNVLWKAHWQSEPIKGSAS